MYIPTKQFTLYQAGRHEVSMTKKSNMSASPQRSFLDLVRQTVICNGHDVFATWYGSQGEAVNEYTFRELWEEAGVISYYLCHTWKLKKGDRVVLCYNFGLHFFASFLGCLRAGIIAVLVYPPVQPLNQSLPKMTKVVTDCDAKLILIDSVISSGKRADKWNPFSKSRQLWPDDSKFRVTDKLLELDRTMEGLKSLQFDEYTLPEDLAFLQYTSGSTGDPKGVMVTFGNLAANVSLIHDGFYQCFEDDGGIPERLAGFSWLPQYHDLGLIYATIAPFAGGWRMHMMSPIDFVKNPLLWIDLMSQHRVHWGVAPDFAFHLVTRKFVHIRQKMGGRDPIPGLDLSCVRNLQNGTEPVKLSTRNAFGKTFAPYGLRENWFHAGYGLAENVVGVCWVHGYYISSPREEDMSSLVAIGSRKTFHSSVVIKIVDPTTSEELADGKTGELWIAGQSVAMGYFGKPELSRHVFGANIKTSPQLFLRTGDLAFFQNHYLFICGRIKDLIIMNGVNYYPQDIELEAQEASSAVRHGCVAVFSSSDTSNGADYLEIVFEIRDANRKEAADIILAVRHRVTSRIGLLPSRIVAIKERTIPKTTSGKIKRRATQSLLHEGTLNVVCDWSRSNEIFKGDESTGTESIDSHKAAGADTDLAIQWIHLDRGCVFPSETARILSKVLFEAVRRLGELSNNKADDEQALKRKAGVTLEDYIQFHSMLCRPDTACRALESFTGSILFLPHDYPRNLEDIHLFDESGLSVREYYWLVFRTFTGMSTFCQRTDVLVSREETGDIPLVLEGEHDKMLRIDPCALEYIKRATKSDLLYLVRRFEYRFHGHANISVMMLHLRSENGMLHLIELHRKLDQSEISTPESVDRDILDWLTEEPRSESQHHSDEFSSIVDEKNRAGDIRNGQDSKLSQMTDDALDRLREIQPNAACGSPIQPPRKIVVHTCNRLCDSLGVSLELLPLELLKKALMGIAMSPTGSPAPYTKAEADYFLPVDNSSPVTQHPQFHGLVESNLDSHVVVVGAGIVGLCFARDMVSLGYRVTIVEKTSRIGGVWETNDYPGLRLQLAGCSYRCLSLAPQWTKQHAPSEHYRPTRKEILNYCAEMVQHPNIELVLSSTCYYENLNQSDGCIDCKIGGRPHMTKFIFESTGANHASSGDPVAPIPLAKDPRLNDLLPLCMHSSQMNAEMDGVVRASSGRVIIVGSGKAAVDLLQSFEQKDSVIWAHRGHTMFVDRAFLDGQFARNGEDTQEMMELSSTKMLHRCKGPVTTQESKFGLGVFSASELAHADLFEQLIFSSIEVTARKEVAIRADAGNADVLAGEGDCIIFCTGQRNSSSNFLKPCLRRNFASSGPFSLNGTTNALIPLRIAFEHLQGSTSLISVAEKRCKAAVELFLSSCTSDTDSISPRALDWKLHHELRPLTNIIFKNVRFDLAFCRKWVEDWYGRDLSVRDVFDVLDDDQCSDLFSRSSIKVLGVLSQKGALCFDSTYTSKEPSKRWFRKVDSWQKANEKSAAAQRTVSDISTRRHVLLSPSAALEAVRFTVASVLSLPLEQIALNRPLHELGLSSMTATALTQALRECAGKDIPIGLVYAGTVKNIASLISDSDSVQNEKSPHPISSSRLDYDLPTKLPSFLSTSTTEPLYGSNISASFSHLQPSDCTDEGMFVSHRQGDVSKVPYAFLYTALGLGYGSQLLHHLPTSAPFYTTQAPEWTEEIGGFANWAERVEHHTEAFIRKFSKSGVHLIGYSMGGILAYCLARQLKEADVQVSLTLLDPHPAQPRLTMPSRLARRAIALDTAVVGLQPSFIQLIMRDEGAIDSHAMLDAEIRRLARGNEQDCTTLRRLSHLSASLQASIQTIDLAQHGLDGSIATVANSRTIRNATVFILSEGAELFDPIMPCDYNDDEVYGWSRCFQSLRRIDVHGKHGEFFSHPQNEEALAKHLLVVGLE